MCNTCVVDEVPLCVCVCVCVFGVGAGEGGRHAITAEDLELHNQAGGSWTIISGRVYDLDAAEVGNNNLAIVYVLVCLCLQPCRGRVGRSDCWSLLVKT